HRTAAATSALHPLSLHDALPISHPEREVVDVDGRGRRARAAEGRAGPVRVEDGVSLEQGLDRRQPSRLHGELVAMRREDRLAVRSEEHTSELQSRSDLVCRLLLE